MNGAKRWFFPDGYIPSGKRGYLANESLCIMNANEETAKIKIWFFFEDRDPLSHEVEVPPKRSLHLRLDKLGIPRCKPYSIMAESTTPVVMQLSRLDVGKEHHTLMTTIGYWEEG